MGKATGIQWCDHTFNAWWGCIEDGPECDNCYARTFAKRTGHNVWGLGDRRFFGDVHWKEPLLWNVAAEKAGIRRRVFCGSMMDIGEWRSDPVGERMNVERQKLWYLIQRTPWLDYLLLSKRPQNFHRVLPEPWLDMMPRNVWLGTTAGTLDGWEKRVKYLRKLMPVVRFVSVEPQLETLGSSVDLSGIHWVIQGGESGGGARFFDLGWARTLRDQCAASGVAYFLKQLGSELALKDRKGGDEDEWPIDLRGCRAWPHAHEKAAAE